MASTTFTTKSGNKYHIAPLLSNTVLKTTRQLKKTNPKLNPNDPDFENQLVFQEALAANLCTIEVTTGDGGLRTLDANEKLLHLQTVPGAMSFVISKAREISDESSANEFEGAEKN